MDAFDHPIQTLFLSLPLAEDLVTDPKQDYIFNASTITINDTFVTAYTAFLEGIYSKVHSRVLVVQNEFLSLFPETIVVVPTLFEAQDLIQMERIERDLGFKMKLTILGCNAATPRINAQTTAQLLEIKGQMVLIDCGEGTQLQLRKLGVKFARIQYIFISHLHGDHFYGLIGLISTFRLLGRAADLHVYGPKGIKEIITLQLKLANSWTDYKLYFHELDSSDSEMVLDHEKFTVETMPLDHRVYTNGYLLEKNGATKNRSSCC